MAIRGLKTKIAFNVATLVLLSAIITDVLVVTVVQSVLVRQEVKQSRQILGAIGQQIIISKTHLNITLQEEMANIAAQMATSTELSTIRVTDASGRILHQKEDITYPAAKLPKTLPGGWNNNRSIPKNLGMVWSGFWWHPKAVIVSVPVEHPSNRDGLACGIISLMPIYQRVSQLNKPILLYIVFNTAVLTMIGLYRIFRLYFRPIDRIVRQADEYHEDGDLFFAFRQEDNQLNRLSSSLNQMLNRIKADKETLKTTVLSLEKANAALKNAQKKIVQAEKMASVGRLASGIAHEIGNPIGIVLGYLELLKKSDLDDGEKNDFLRRTEDEVQRINAVIRQLLDLARPKDTIMQRVDLNDVIEDIMEVVRVQPSMSGIQFNAQLNHGQCTLWANADQLRQVFLNLLINAVDAIQSRVTAVEGKITIQTRCLNAKDSEQSPRVQIRFEDNGIGMAQAGLDSIFDPFYTTKDPGKGTGLGLAVSYMIIEGMEGTLWAESEQGVGSTLTVELPLAKPEAGNTDI